MQSATRSDDRGTYDVFRPQILRLIERGDFTQAAALLGDLARALPVDPVLLQDLAHCHWQLGDQYNALQLIGAAAENRPDDPGIWARMGAMAYGAGQIELSRHALEAALNLRPDFAAALVALNRIEPFARDGQRGKKLRALAQRGQLKGAERVNVCHALGVIEAAAGNQRAAMGHFGRAKAMLPGRYDAQAMAARIDAQRCSFPAQEHADMVGTGPRMAFVVGMPRSGTTLVESILLRHDGVASVGESHALAECLAQLRESCARRSGSAEPWGWLDQREPDDLPRLRSRYLALAGVTSASESAAVLVDKTPLNALEMGFASYLFPGARFIFMSRHPLDVGLSNYVTNFTAAFVAANPYAKRLKSIGHFMRCLYDSLEDYRAKLGPALRVQSYAALVRDPEIQVRAMLAHLGLDWNAACLTPEMRAGVVRTASAAQIREPINRAGLEKWRTYETELAPLIQALGGWDWISAWESADLACADG